LRPRLYVRVGSPWKAVERYVERFDRNNRGPVMKQRRIVNMAKVAPPSGVVQACIRVLLVWPGIYDGEDCRNTLPRSGISSAADDTAVGRQAGYEWHLIVYESLMRIYWKTCFS
jgi:hypothetical protein